MDPEAHDNLVGGRTADRMAEQTGKPSKSLHMNKAMQGECVGKDSLGVLQRPVASL